jgi:hypothetical protein
MVVRPKINANELVNALRDAQEKNATVSVDGKVDSSSFSGKNATWAVGLITSRHSRLVRANLSVSYEVIDSGGLERHVYNLKSEVPPYELTVKIKYESQKNYYSGIVGVYRLIRDAGKAVLQIRKEDSEKWM